MTKSAKQDAKKPAAQSVATESAATQAAAKATDTEAAETVAADTVAADKTAGGGAATSAEDAAAPDLDETKRKFREALERKHQVHNDGQGKGGRDGSKINGAHGPAASRRNFRRKSG